MREYIAVIGDRTLRVSASNVWQAAERAAVTYSSLWREGLLFFRGTAQMALWRVGMDAPIFVGDYAKWAATFQAQGRSIERWDRLQRKAA